MEGTNGQGDIYQAQDDDGTTYYFAGNPDDNWVSFAGYYWRIIRINGDGTIRLIYSGTSSPVTTGAGTRIQLINFNNAGDRSYFVGFKYSDTQHGTTTESRILQNLNIWYNSNISSIYQNYIDINAGFCGDREMASGSYWNATSSISIYYAAYERLEKTSNSVKPTFKCSNNSDLYTVGSSIKGNKSLTNPIGLITADEVIYGGLARNATTTDNYLYTNQDYWTISPYNFNSAYAWMFRVNSDGNLDGWGGRDDSGVRPLINLRADVELTGTGTSTDPYQLS